MADFEVWQAPALDAQVLSHHRETFGFDFADVLSPPRIWRAYPATSSTVEERREHKSVTMPVGPHQQHRPTDRIETYPSAAAHVIHVHAAVVAPGVEVEGPTAIDCDAVGVDDIQVKGDQLLQDIGGKFDDIDVEPKHPVLLAQRAEQQVVARLGEHCATLRLINRLEARDVARHDQTEVFLEDVLAAEILT